MNDEDQIRRLQQDLYAARHTILGLLPEPAHSILGSYWERNTASERLSWEHDILDEIIDLAVEIEGAASYWQPRGYCPLCGHGTTWAYSEGFTLPEGLKRHLTGWGNVQQCSVMEAAIGLAYSSWGRTRWQLRQEHGQEEEFAREQRRTTEPQLQIAPGAKPLLFDEHESYLRSTRTPEQLQFAVERLRELGFACNEDGLVISYTRELDDLILYADPRIEGRIDFRVFRKDGSVTEATDAPGFSIQDRWVHRLEERLVTAARTKLTTK